MNKRTWTLSLAALLMATVMIGCAGDMAADAEELASLALEEESEDEGEGELGVSTSALTAPTCGGSAAPCWSLIFEGQCVNQFGCGWDRFTGTCGGSATPCKNLSGANCGYQLGCMPPDTNPQPDPDIGNTPKRPKLKIEGDPSDGIFAISWPANGEKYQFRTAGTISESTTNRWNVMVHTSGSHTFEVRACNQSGPPRYDWDCSLWSSVTVEVLRCPAPGRVIAEQVCGRAIQLTLDQANSRCGVCGVSTKVVQPGCLRVMCLDRLH